MSSKSNSVVLTEGAEHDLESIYEYIAAFDSIRSANYVLDRLTDAMGRLSRFPERGTYPKELIALGMREFRQIAFKPYRVIYRVHESRVVIYLVADGRRDMQSLLARRLLGASGEF